MVVWLMVWVVGAFAPATALADRAEDIARIHTEAIGGLERIRALSAVRMIGHVTVRDELVPVTLIAARPNRVRVETRFEFRRVVQAWDGVGAPWEIDPAKSPRPVTMSAGAAEMFRLDADFDDPLVRAPERQMTLEFAGETDVGGRRLLRVLVSRSLTAHFHVLIDPESHLIFYRLHELTRGGRKVDIVTRYSDFRPVQDVLIAHEVSLFVGGQLSQQAKFERIEANPRLSADIFAPPVSAPAAEATNATREHPR